MSTLDPQLASQLEQVRRDFAKAFRVLKESRTLTATNTYQAYVRVPDSDQVIAVHAPTPGPTTRKSARWLRPMTAK